ncbi:MAG TPA: IS4 family transposase [Saprospiraceae bacterium]|nr:IS4 family transposase [Saprospiraceae bacterium]
MATRGKVKQLTGEMIKDLDTLTKPRIDLIALFILSIVKVTTVNLAKIALAMETKSKTGSNYRRLQRFMREVNWDETGLISLILKWLKIKEDGITLLIDRTNWDFGKKKINILMVSLLYEGYSVPLGWSLLNKKGNSNQGERWDLINKIIEKIGPRKIKYIIGDREFGGEYWYKYLNSKGITFVIRIKENQKVKFEGREMSVKNIVKSNSRRGKQCNNRKYQFGEVDVYISGFRFRNDQNKLEYLIIFSQEKINDTTAVYGQRWQIESMFKNMKSSGFNIEDTHLQRDSRISTLLGLIAISYTWMLITGY